MIIKISVSDIIHEIRHFHYIFFGFVNVFLQKSNTLVLEISNTLSLNLIPFT
jgi:hypothetical protein